MTGRVISDSDSESDSDGERVRSRYLPPTARIMTAQNESVTETALSVMDGSDAVSGSVREDDKRDRAAER